jgi:hypothetical protein
VGGRREKRGGGWVLKWVFIGGRNEKEEKREGGRAIK